MKKLKLLVLILCILTCAPAHGQEYLVSVLKERSMNFDAQLDSILTDFGAFVDTEQYRSIINTARKIGRPTHYVAVEYNTVDPKGNPIVASGIIAYPEKGKFRGTVEVSPYTKEKYLCGTARMFAAECMPTNFGYVTLLPDTIGYGSTADLPIAYLMYENVARVSADLRMAAREFFAAQGEGRTLPDKTIFFGYSLGAPGALETACYYTAHPEYGVKIKRICIGSGAYHPELALQNTVYKGEITYLIYPGIALSLNTWLDLGLDYNKLFWGDVIDDFDKICDGMSNMREMAERYGFRVQNYLYPDFFLPEKNGDIDRLVEGLKSLHVPSEGYVLPRNVKINMHHCVEDLFVPVECSDLLYEELKKNYRHVNYIRIPKGTHYDGAAITLADLMTQLIW